MDNEDSLIIGGLLIGIIGCLLIIFVLVVNEEEYTKVLNTTIVSNEYLIKNNLA